jgi:hypothetical protein
MTSDLFSEDDAMRIYQQWRAEPVQRKKDWLLLDLWKATEPLAKNRIFKMVAYMPPHFGEDDWLSLLRQKFVYVVTKAFNPERAKLYSLLYKSFDNVIRTKLGQLSRGKNKDGAPIITYEGGLNGSYSEPDADGHTGFERLEVAFIRARGGCHGLGRKRASDAEDI